MKPTTRNKIVIWCASLAVTVVAGAASAIATFNLANNSIIVPTEGVHRTAKTEPFAFPDVTSMVARDRKSDLLHQTAVPQTVVKSPRADISADTATSPRNSKTTPVTTEDTVATVAVNDPPAPKPDTTSPATNTDEANVVIEPASSAPETSTNVTSEPEASNPSSRAAWRYSNPSMARAQRRARYLWDVLVAQD